MREEREIEDGVTTKVREERERVKGQWRRYRQPSILITRQGLGEITEGNGNESHFFEIRIRLSLEC